METGIGLREAKGFVESNGGSYLFLTEGGIQRLREFFPEGQVRVGD